ncbi:zinc finger, PHD-type containing protein [Tanacetum coccineum]
MNDMTACLNDLSYIPPNNEQNKSTQGDIGETSNEPTQAIRKRVERSYMKVQTEELKGYKLPSLYYAIKKTFKTIGLWYESIHACVNDCYLFRGEDNKDKQFYPVCNTSRWKDNHTTGKKVPKKVLRYFPIIPRLQRLYKSSHTAKEMTWHATGKCTEPGKMQHPVDGRAWKKFDTRYPKFAAEPRNVRLGLAADGFNPFGNLSQSYSMWPVILTTYNLPPWLCMKESYLMLTLLIPGPKSPGKDIDVYLRPLIDDLKDLWALKGVETIDVATGQKFNMRAMVLWTVVCLDGVGRSPINGGGHVISMVKPKTEILPENLTRIKFDLNFIEMPVSKGQHPSYGGVKIKLNVLVELNWTKRSIFYELKYWSFLTLKHNLDVMHIEKNVLEIILNTLLMNDKSKDTTKARQDLKNLGIQSELWLIPNKNGKCSKPQAMYSFTPKNRKKFCQFIKGVKLPDGFGSNFKHKVTDNDSNITGMKSHDCYIMIQRLLPYGLQQYLPHSLQHQ